MSPPDGASGLLRVAGGEVLEGTRRRRADIIVEHGRISGIVGPGVGRTPDATVIDARGRVVSPGFVDLQINGGWGIDLASEPGRIWELAAALPATGVTGFLPTLVSSPSIGYRLALETIAARPDGFVGAEPLGWHFEGPMLAPTRAGAHDPEYLAAATPARIEGWTRDHGVSMVTLAPELEGADEVTRRLVSAGVVVSMGHTDGDTAAMRRGIDAGARHVTHLYNAMRAFHHRDPGPVGVALADDRLSVGLIADGAHAAAEALVVAWRTIGADRVCLVTDAVAAMGTHAADGLDAPTRSDGTLAGTVLTMDAAVRRIAEITGAPIDEILAAASTTPARVVDSPAHAGIHLGARADLVVLDDRLHVDATVCAGQVAYRRDR